MLRRRTHVTKSQKNAQSFTPSMYFDHFVNAQCQESGLIQINLTLTSPRPDIRAQVQALKGRLNSYSEVIKALLCSDCGQQYKRHTNIYNDSKNDSIIINTIFTCSCSYQVNYSDARNKARSDKIYQIVSSHFLYCTTSSCNPDLHQQCIVRLSSAVIYSHEPTCTS